MSRPDPKLAIATFAAFTLGWLAGTAISGWAVIAAWVLAVFAATLVVAAVIDHGYETERAMLRVSAESCRRRVREEREAREAAQGKLKLLKVELADALDALAMANRLHR